MRFSIAPCGYYRWRWYRWLCHRLAAHAAIRRIMCITSDVIAPFDIHPLRMCRMRRRKIAERIIACSRGALALVHRISQVRILLLPFVLSLSACQTIDEAPTSSSWSATPSFRASEGTSRPDRTGSALLLANTRGGQSTVIEGSGRFVGDPPTGAIGRPSEDVTEVSRSTSSTCRRRRRPDRPRRYSLRRPVADVTIHHSKTTRSPSPISQAFCGYRGPSIAGGIARRRNGCCNSRHDPCQFT